MKSTAYTRFCRRKMTNMFQRFNISETTKTRFLEKADIAMVYQEYFSMVLMNIIIGFIASFIPTLLLYILFPNNITALLMLIVTALVPLVIGMVYLQLPASMAKTRGKNIDKYLPYVTNFINTMSVAGISPSEIFGTISGIPLYGEVQKEAKKITTEIELMGVDAITALHHAIAISPSKKWTEFIQGILGVIQSGSELGPYFDRCVERYMFEDLEDRKKNLDSLAVMAESFVVTVVAFPLFLLIIITIMGLTSGGIDYTFMGLLAFIIIPMAYAGFYVMMKSGMGEEI